MPTGVLSHRIKIAASLADPQVPQFDRIIRAPRQKRIQAIRITSGIAPLIELHRMSMLKVRVIHDLQGAIHVHVHHGQLLVGAGDQANVALGASVVQGEGGNVLSCSVLEGLQKLVEAALLETLYVVGL